MISDYRRRYAEIRRSYTPEKAADERRNELLAHLFYRPVSFGVTPLFLAAGFSADGITVLAFAGAALLPVLALGLGAAAWPWVVAIAIGIQVLDCVDGNIARATGRSSAVGGLLDSLTTVFFWSFYFCAVGFLAYGEGAGWIGRHGRELGLALAALFLGQRQMEDTHASYLAERVRFAPPAPPGVPAFDVGQVAKVLEHVAAFGGLAVAGALGWIGPFFAVIALYQSGATALWLVRFARKLLAQRAASLGE